MFLRSGLFGWWRSGETKRLQSVPLPEMRGCWDGFRQWDPRRYSLLITLINERKLMTSYYCYFFWNLNNKIQLIYIAKKWEAEVLRLASVFVKIHSLILKIKQSRDILCRNFKASRNKVNNAKTVSRSWFSWNSFYSCEGRRLLRWYRHIK